MTSNTDLEVYTMHVACGMFSRQDHSNDACTAETLAGQVMMTSSTRGSSS